MRGSKLEVANSELNGSREYARGTRRVKFKPARARLFYLLHVIIGKSMILRRGSKVGGILSTYRLRFLLSDYYSTSYNPYFFPVMLKNAIQHVVDDSSFHLKVEPAATALQQAKYVADLILQNRMPDLLFLFDQISVVTTTD